MLAPEALAAIGVRLDTSRYMSPDSAIVIVPTGLTLRTR